MQTLRPILWLIPLLLCLKMSLTAQSGTAGQFIPVTPCRLVDTRQSGGPITGGTSETFNLIQSAETGGCQNLSLATAYSLNVTVVPHGYLGYLTIWPAGQVRPTISLMNSLDGRIKANAAIVPAGANGGVSVYVTNTADVVLDIDGYFEPANAASLAYYPLTTPCRVADTRQSGAPLPAGTETDFSILTSSCIPQGANPESYALNFTAVPNPSGQPLYYLTVWPKGASRPTISTLNNVTGTIVANAAIVPASGTGGEVAVYPSNTTDLVIDMDGYFAPPAPQGLAFYSLTPCRAIDTRPHAFSGQQIENIVGGACLPPSVAAGYVLNATALPQGDLGYLTLWPDGLPQPLVSTLNATDGAYTSNMAIVGTTNGSIDAYASGTTNLLLDLSGYMAPLPTLAVGSSSLPAGSTGQLYQAQLAASGGEPPYSWTISGGSLPPGLTMGNGGLITGYPTSNGAFPLTVKVTDQFSSTATANLTVSVAVGQVNILTTQLPNATQGVFYTATVQAGGGSQPYTWSVVAGALPNGLSLDSSSGVISGTPTILGVSNFTIQARDAQSNAAQATLQILVNPSNGVLSGNYAIVFHGFKNGSPFIMVGAILTDGNGNITGGKIDYNDGTGEPNNPSQCHSNPICPIAQVVQSPGSTYDLSAGNGLGSMTIRTLDNSGNPHTYTFSISVSGNGCLPNQYLSACGRLIENDAQMYGSGLLKVQDPAYFSIPAFFPGNFALSLLGIDPTGNRFAAVGAIGFAPPPHLVDIDCNGNGWGLENCPLDTNDNGNNGSSATVPEGFNGTFSAYLDTTTGRGDYASMFFPNDPNGRCTGALHGGSNCGYAYYFINYQEMILISSDPLSKPANMTIWLAYRQKSNPNWSSASLNGASVMAVDADDNGKSDVSAGIFTANGAGDATFASDENDGGSLTQQQPSPGTYAVSTVGNKTGQVTLSGFTQFGSGGAVMYLYSGIDQHGQPYNAGYVLGTDAKVTAGAIQPQAGAPYSYNSVNGNYAGGSITPALAAVTNSVTSIFADGIGHIVGTQYTSGPSGVTGPNSLNLTYQVDQTGRAVVTNQQDGSEYGILYVVGPNKLVLVPTGNAPALNLFFSGEPD